MTTTSRAAALRRTWSRVRTVPGLGRDVTALVLLVALGLTVGGYILVNQRVHWPWTDEFVFSADFRAAPGISPGNGQEVRIAGVSVGDIRTAEVSNDGRARLTMSIEPGYTVYDNARLVLRPKSPLNEMYIELNPGGKPGRALRDGQVLPVARSANPVQIDEVLQHLDSRSRAALTSLLGEADAALASAPEGLPAGLRAANGTLVDLEPVVSALQTRRQTIRDLVTALARISSAVGGDDERLARLATSMQQTLTTVAARNDELEATLRELPGVTGELRRATGSVQELSDQLDPTLDDLRRASATLPDSLDRLTGTVDRLESTVEAARPVVRTARPVVADLRPLVRDANGALTDIRAVSRRLDLVTAALLPYLTDLQAFVNNTRSVGSVEDANGGIVRGLFLFAPSSVPLKQR
jgi:phospholipid/cholesterol/gamma-HCH transport system substrate-binding protein